METIISFFVLHLSSQFLSYLWGMETWNSFKYDRWRIKFLSYLWGMETQHHSNNLKTIFLFLSYLWGMETFQSTFQPRYFCNRSYPTYEEWKHEPVKFLDHAMDASSYPTYEEWKPGSIFHNFILITSFLSYLWGMETFIWDIIYWQILVLILPMRNGNKIKMK